MGKRYLQELLSKRSFTGANEHFELIRLGFFSGLYQLLPNCRRVFGLNCNLESVSLESVGAANLTETLGLKWILNRYEYPYLNPWT